MAFSLTTGLAQKEFICDLPFCRVLFEDNADYPWIFLVPRKENVRNMLDHIICRFKGDLYWPDTVWGGKSRPYLTTIKYQTIDRIKKEILSCQKLLS